MQVAVRSDRPEAVNCFSTHVRPLHIVVRTHLFAIGKEACRTSGGINYSTAFPFMLYAVSLLLEFLLLE